MSFAKQQTNRNTLALEASDLDKMLNNASKERSVSFMTEKSQTEIIALGDDMANFSFHDIMAQCSGTPTDEQ